MTAPADVLRVATTDLGLTESPPNSNDQKFGIWYGADRQPWCAMFVSWCFYNAGSPLAFTTPKGFAYCPYGIKGFKDAGQLIDKNLADAGDVVFFDWEGDGISDHVGIVEHNLGNGAIITIEGNTSAGENGSQSNGGGVFRRTRQLKSVSAVGRPAYNGQPAPAAPAPQPPSAPPAPPIPPFPGRIIHLTTPFTHGEDVRRSQQQLKNRGWKISVDGVYGTASVGIVKAFQTEKHLLSDGVIGPITWAAFFTAPIT